MWVDGGYTAFIFSGCGFFMIKIHSSLIANKYKNRSGLFLLACSLCIDKLALAYAAQSPVC